MNNLFKIIILILITGCSYNKSINKPRTTNNRYAYAQDGYPNPHHIPNLANVREPIPKYEPKSRYGNPPKYKIFNKTYSVLKSSDGYRERGYASWYGTKFHGYKTSNGETYDMYSFTAAHKTLPLPTYAKITNLHNKHSIIVKINDRGPFHGDRLIDLSYAAANKLGIISSGVGMVEITAINPGKNFNTNTNKKTVNTKIKQTSLQLGAFSQKENAENLAKQLESLLKHHENNYKINIISLKNNLKNSAKKNILYKVIISSASGELNVPKIQQVLSNIRN